MAQTIIDFALQSLEAQARMREGGSQSGWSGDLLNLQRAHGIPYMEVFNL